jgi:phospholipid-binding lipoprotein MlaA
MRRSALAAALLFGLAIASSASAAPDHAPGDRFERANRVGYAIHQVFDRLLIRPLALTYKTLTPGFVRKGVRNVLDNLDEPVVMLNDLFQGHGRKAGDSTLRFAVNSTLGVAGVFDVAGKMGIPHHDNTFAFTLGRHHVKPGPYLFIPLVGPSTVRDLFGRVVDGTIDPFHWIRYRSSREIIVGRAVIGGLDVRAEADDDLNALMAGATDPYATLRSVYLQNQQSQIDGDDAKTLPALPDFDDPAAPTTKPAADPAPKPDEKAADPAPGPAAAAPPPPPAAP